MSICHWSRHIHGKVQTSNFVLIFGFGSEYPIWRINVCHMLNVDAFLGEFCSLSTTCGDQRNHVWEESISEIGLGTEVNSMFRVRHNSYSTETITRLRSYHKLHHTNPSTNSCYIDKLICTPVVIFLFMWGFERLPWLDALTRFLKRLRKFSRLYSSFFIHFIQFYSRLFPVMCSYFWFNQYIFRGLSLPAAWFGTLSTQVHYFSVVLSSRVQKHQF